MGLGMGFRIGMGMGFGIGMGWDWDGMGLPSHLNGRQVAGLPDLECCQPSWTNRTWEMLPAFLDEPDLGMLPAFLDEPDLGILLDSGLEIKIYKERALADFTAASEKRQKSSIYARRAEIYKILRQYDNALNDLDTALKINKV
ncbi:hypothetical protein RclHR1_24900002 [Rhizophagus clarus]|uniref:Uncharacterized protein n=1 Tax=Rhizophagus clarus TaxID=94130 RepID=A0A2Z6RC72_9GLOM|nr:hypothetical protein RclHR1_24900002 [Rhizophagus clarus]